MKEEDRSRRMSTVTPGRGSSSGRTSVYGKMRHTSGQSLRAMKQRVHLKSVKSSVERKLRDDLAFYHQGMPLDLLELYDEAKPI